MERTALSLIAGNKRLIKTIYKIRREYLASQFLRVINPNFQNVKESEYTILAGPFKGTKFKLFREPTQFAENTTLIQKISGLYEQEILDYIQVSHFDNLIDLGTGDGYYGIGMLAKGYTRRVFFYESDDYRKSLIAINASINGIQSNKIFIRQFADPSLILSDLHSDSKNASQKTLIICDLEGFEKELFTESFLKELQQEKAIILMEYHPNLIKKYNSDHNFIGLLESYYKVTPLNNMARNLKDQFLDAPLVDDRWLLTSESRAEGIQLLLQ